MSARALNSEAFQPRTILLTGATGYVGSLILASLLSEGASSIIALVREGHTRESVLEPVEVELRAAGLPIDDATKARVKVCPMPAAFPDMSALANDHLCWDVDEIIHCAGCVDYFDVERLELVNIEFTRALLHFAEQMRVRRFTFISTAYSCGYRNSRSPEALHEMPLRDPTAYTRTKREAEHLVAAGSVPFLILRPAVLIGHSSTGRYSGRRYGLYQQWMGLERLVCNRYHEEFHTVAPRMPLALIHQDAFQAVFLMAHRYLPNGAIVHVVSDSKAAPSMRDLWDMWLEITRPKRVFYYPSLADVPLQTIHIRQRAYLTFAQVNLEIAAHRWEFDTGWLDVLRARGLRFHDVNAASILKCQERFVRSSPLMQEYLQKYADILAPEISFSEVQPLGRVASAT